MKTTEVRFGAISGLCYAHASLVFWSQEYIYW